MSTAKTTARRDGRKAEACAKAATRRKTTRRWWVPKETTGRKTKFQRDVAWFIHDYGNGGVDPEAVRYEYDALLKSAKGREKRYASELKAAKAAYDNAIKRAFLPTKDGEYKGLWIEGGGIQLPEKKAVDVGVYTGPMGAPRRLIGFVNGQAKPGRDFTKRRAEIVNEYLRLAGARIAS